MDRPRDRAEDREPPEKEHDCGEEQQVFVQRCRNGRLFDDEGQALRRQGGCLMGEDGAIGAGAIKRAGGKVICQNERSCVVYGMPKAVVDAGHADGLFDVKQIARVLRNTLADITDSGGDLGRQERRSA